MSLNDQYYFENSLRAGFYAGLTASSPVPSGAEFIFTKFDIIV